MVTGADPAGDRRGGAVGEEDADTDQRLQDRSGDSESRELRRTEMPDDRRIGQQHQRLGHQGEEGRNGQSQDLPVLVPEETSQPGPHAWPVMSMRVIVPDSACAQPTGPGRPEKGIESFSSPQLCIGETAGQRDVVDRCPQISTGICPTCAHLFTGFPTVRPQGVWTTDYHLAAGPAYGRVTDAVRPQSRGRVRLRMAPANRCPAWVAGPGEEIVGGFGYGSIRCSILGPAECFGLA